MTSTIERDRGPRPRLHRAYATLAMPLAVLLVLVMHDPAAAATYYVGGSGCSDGAGVGSSSQPFCTISAALAKRHSAGTIIEVRSGTYREQVTVPASGTSSAPIVIRAASGAAVTVDGADDLSSTSRWTLYSGSVYRAASVTWTPKYVLVDGTALASYSGSKSDLPDKRWTYVSGEGLYLRYGSSNPGSRTVLIGRRSYGVYIASRSYVTVQGLTIVRAGDRGIQVNNSDHINLLSNNISKSGRMGVQLKSCSFVRVASNKLHDNGDHGLALITDTNDCTIEKNECYKNAYASARSANGIYVNDSWDNDFLTNRLHDNQDSGITFTTGANDNLCVQNRSWKNGDHGYDHVRATGNRHIGDVSFGNLNDGFSIEGSATGQVLYNCISVDNGITTNHSDLYLEDGSNSGFDSNDNLFWNSTSQSPIRYRGTRYSTVSSYASASGEDSRTIQSNPRFAGASSGDFHLLSGSPAIDNANSSVAGWSSKDADGKSRYDDPNTANKGLGTVKYADRGSLEFTGGTNTAGEAIALDAAMEPAPPDDPPPGDAAPSDPALNSAITEDGEWNGTAEDGATPDTTAEPGEGHALWLAIQPNPVRGEGAATVSFRLEQRGHVTATIYTVAGRRASQVVEMDLEAGEHTLPLPGDERGVPLQPGVYFCEIRAPEGRAVQRVVIVP